MVEMKMGVVESKFADIIWKNEPVLAHEEAHLKRHDHWWKPLGFVILSVTGFIHWSGLHIYCFAGTLNWRATKKS